MAECHPVGFRFVMKARERGAKVIHVDPRFSRTSAVANMYMPIRAGSDIAFLGGLVRYIIENDRHFKEYVVHYTNASFLVSDDFRDTEDSDGLFSGWDPENARYDPSSWAYRRSTHAQSMSDRATATGEPHSEGGSNVGPARESDPTLQDPRCVFQILRRHFSRYTPEVVEELCGVPREQFLKVAETICGNSGRERTTAFCYAVGWTQHSVGVQYIRTAAIIQLLLGNIGRPGGGIMALRGHASIQGSTDIPTLYNLLPGYLPMPKAGKHNAFRDYLKDTTAASGWWTEAPKYIVSLLKAWFGDAATRENDWCYEHLPMIDGDHSHLTTISRMADGTVKGYFVMGENPTVGSPHGALQREGLRKLDWLVVRDVNLIETAEFWRIAPEIDRGEVRPEDIATEVFFMPAAAHTEKNGCFTNTQRLLQWHHKAVDPPGDARSETHFMYHLAQRLKKLYAGSQKPRDRAIQAITMDYPLEGDTGEPVVQSVLQEINGYNVADCQVVPGFTALKDDGSTACGCWIYSGVYAGGVNRAANRTPAQEQTWVAPEWGFAWPANRHILYNRASADPEGRPWSDRKKYVWWDEQKKEWTGYDNPDFIRERPPDYRPGPDAEGIDTISGVDPFVLQGDGKGWLYAPNGLQDGPMPTHYEPQESAVHNSLYRQQCNPARMEFQRRDNPYHRPWEDPRFPYVITTYRVTEHHTAGGMSRWLPWLSELQPALFCEVSEELAAKVGLINGGWATIRTARAEIEARVLVTNRVRPLRIQGRTIHQIGLPYHFGGVGLVRGDATNELFGFVADPNVSIPESKAITADIEPGRRSRERRIVTSGPLVPALSEDLRRESRDIAKRPETPHGRNR
jgi:formate dehydrogenase major subunit